MDLTLGDPEVKVQLFRFIDAMPVAADDRGGPRPLRRVPRPRPATGSPGGCGWRSPWRPRNSPGARLLAGLLAVRGDPHGPAVHRRARTPSRRWRPSARCAGRRLAFTADLLGEAVISEHEADVYQQTCLDLLRGLAGPLAAEPEIPLIDRDDRGPIPRANLSLKLTSLTARFDALHAEATADRVADAAPADPPDGPGARGLRPRRHGAVRPQGLDPWRSSGRS